MEMLLIADRRERIGLDSSLVLDEGSKDVVDLALHDTRDGRRRRLVLSLEVLHCMLHGL